MKLRMNHLNTEKPIRFSKHAIRQNKCAEAFQSVRSIEKEPTIHHSIGSRILAVRGKGNSL